MRTKISFTDEAVNRLRENRYTAYASRSTIRFTLEFKQYLWDQLQKDIPASRIFQNAGYDIDVLGQARIRKFAKRVREEAVSPSGLHKEYGTRKKHLDALDYEQMQPDAVLAAMQKELLYLRQEVEFIKKIIKTESGGGRKI